MKVVSDFPGLIVGLTGGIGSGKSAAARYFAELGAAVIDVDAIAHELTGPQGAAMPALVAAFGENIAEGDGRLNRAAMRQLAFSEPSVRKRLEGILHPMIGRLSDERCRQALAAGAAYGLLVVPLLVESPDYQARVQRIAVVDCRDETRIERVMSRSGLSRKQVLAIMAAQSSREARLAIADDVIDNEGDWMALQTRVEALHRQYLQFVAIPRKSEVSG